jgi:putative peptide zinc metalloprotease protein
MNRPLFSTSWYRVASLRPRLRRHAEIHRHTYRGQTWYVLQDRATERYHRFSPAAYAAIGLLDGRRTVQQIWNHLQATLGDEAPTQDEIIQLLGQLHAADGMQCETSPDTDDLLRRFERQSKQKWQRRVFSLFSWQFPLIDPEPVLRRFAPLARPFMTWGGLALWLAIVVPAMLVAASHWSELAGNIVDRVTTPQNLLLLWLLFPVIKILHELGHAFAVKAFGGEVHEIGVMLLVFTPVPYVDASAASGFRNKWHRAVVGAAGMAVELVLAAVAVYIWVTVQPGTLRALAYNTVLIAGVSTVLFNANPLLRFDGYYILADVLEIPNLRQRATKYFGYLAERYLFGHPDSTPPESTPGERAWFVGFGAASFVYRILVTVAIIFFLLDEIFLIGALFGAAAIVLWGVVPIAKGAAFLWNSPRLQEVRPRAVAVCAGLVLLIVGVISLAPMPFRTRAEGVVWIPENAFVRAGTDGFIRRIVAGPGQSVKVGDILVECEDPELTTEMKTLEFRLREIDARHRDEYSRDLVKAQLLLEERRYVEEQLARARERANDLTIRSHNAGQFVVAAVEDLPGRFLKQGDQVGYVVDLSTTTVRALVDQTDIDLILRELDHVDVRVAERLSEPHRASVQRVVPAATDELPSPALGTEGGGQVALDPQSKEGKKTLQRLFQVELALPSATGTVNAGGRVLIRFDHGARPLGVQWYRAIRQTFLSRFNV